MTMHCLKVGRELEFELEKNKLFGIQTQPPLLSSYGDQWQIGTNKWNVHAS